MLLNVVPHRESALSFKSSDSDMWVREEHTITRTNCAACWAAISLPRKIIPRGTSWKEQKGNTAPLTICSPGCGEHQTDYTLTPATCKITCIHPGRQLNSLGLVMRCWRQKREALYVSKNSHAKPLSMWGPLLRSKMTSLEFRHMLVILRSSRSGQRNLKQQVPSRFCAPTRNCIKHRIPTWSIAIMLDPHRDRSCPILPPIRSFDLNHTWEKKKTTPFTFTSRSLTVPRQSLNTSGLKSPNIGHKQCYSEFLCFLH